jgi:hypothetical protein
MNGRIGTMSNWDGKSRPSSDKYRNNFDDIFKKEKLDNDKKRRKTNKEEPIGSFFESCLSPEEKKKRKKHV